MLGDLFNDGKSDQHFGVIAGERHGGLKFSLIFHASVNFNFCKCEFQFPQVCLISATVKSFIFIFRKSVVIYVTILFSFN